MHEGRGDLPRLVRDLETGTLTGTPAGQFLILLQEAVEGSRHDVVSLTRSTGMTAYFAPVRRIDPGISGNAILSTLPLIAPHAVELPVQRQPRSAIVTAVEVRGTRLTIVCAHLENRDSWLRGGVFSDRGRGRQAAALLAQIPQGPAVAGGDFNSLFGETEEAVRLFAQRFTTRVTPDRRREPTFRGRLVLDHLFFDLPQAWSASSWVSRDAYGSDHHPVVGVVAGVVVE